MSDGLQTPTLPARSEAPSTCEEHSGQDRAEAATSGCKTVVLKFGSSVLMDLSSYQDVALEIYRWYREGYRIVAVVSAMGSTTDDLLAETRAEHRWADDAITANLLATGECVSAARLGLALDRFGMPSRVLEPGGLGLKTTGSVLDAKCERLETTQIHRALGRGQVAVVPGFVGQDESGNLTLLGRGGTDLSALFIAEALGADGCHLVKDVDGLYDLDPALHPDKAIQFEHANYRDVLALDEGIVQHKAVQFAQEKDRAFIVRALNRATGTRVYSGASQLLTQKVDTTPLKLAVFGDSAPLKCFLEYVKRFPQHFHIVCACEDSGIHWRHTASVTSLWKVKPQILVDLGQSNEASQIISATALEQGLGLLSTNAPFLAGTGVELGRLFHSQGLPFLVDAAVGGVLPVKETLGQLAGTGQVRVVEALLSWPAQFVLNRLLAGDSLEQASGKAGALGISQSELARAIEGQTSLHQFLICLNLGLDLGLLPSQIEVLSLNSFANQFGALGPDSDWQWRYLAQLNLDPNAIEARIHVRRLDSNHPLAMLPIDGIGVCTHLRNGQRIVLHGRDGHLRSRILAVIGSLMTVVSP